MGYERADVDDERRLDETRDHRARELGGEPHVGEHHRVHLRLARVIEIEHIAIERSDTRIVDQDRHGEVCDFARHVGVHIGRARVGQHRFHLDFRPELRLQLFLHRFEFRGVAAVDDDVEAALCESEGENFADAVCGSRDERVRAAVSIAREVTRRTEDGVIEPGEFEDDESEGSDANIREKSHGEFDGDGVLEACLKPRDVES